ncbi:Hsp20/alpha crystallin family protein [Histomonas meleagridis]|uniref:Hsp20/alpha crystallin family protein n=1 Tax=Histomonas meleagridis TaxID=135588 RepID=UPI003559C3A3|nr:Hsp20/alpha crystallin family protein [Histomonas meleagridis]KAH0804968.1 Hsp20/alpha crystallin family protein [Histomonas meleagridis]
MLSCFNTQRRGFFRTKYCPLADVFKTNKGYEIQIEFPGVKKDDIIIDVEEKILNITAIKNYKQSDSAKPIHNEIKYGTVTRKFRLPSNIETEAIEASLADGVLTLSIPTKEKPKTEIKIL